MDNNDLKEEFENYLQKARNGVSEAMVNLGYCYEKGIGTEQNSSEAVRWAMRAAGLGESQGMCNLARYYENGNGIEKDQEKANSWYRKAALLENGEAMASLGCNYSNGIGVPRDWAMSCKLWCRAVECGVLWPAICAAECYLCGKGTLQVDLELARKYFMMIDKNDSLFDEDEYEDFEEELEQREELVKKGEIISPQSEESWRDSQDPAEIPDPEIRSWELDFLEKTAERMFDKSVDTEDVRDKRRALEYTLAAAERGCIYMTANLGWLYGIGWGIEPDMQQAVKWCMVAVKAGNAMACTHLGRYFEEGKGVKKDLKVAFKLYKKALELTEDELDNELALRLSRCYLYGMGTRKNVKTARHWFRHIEDSNRPEYLKLAEDLEAAEKELKADLQ